jgi:hypothetical protein
MDSPPLLKAEHRSDRRREGDLDLDGKPLATPLGALYDQVASRASHFTLFFYHRNVNSVPFLTEVTPTIDTMVV